MEMSHTKSELCALLIQDTYGTFYSHIFSTLLQHGRLSLADLARRCCFPSRYVRHGIAALVQSHLIKHHTTSTGQTFYSADCDSAYNLIRVGRILRTIEEKLGKYASEVLLQILLLGHAKVGHLSTLPALVGPHTKISLNGDPNKSNENATDSHASSRYTVDDLLTALQQLSDAGFIRRVRGAHFQSAADNQADVEQHIHATHAFVNNRGKKMQDEFDLLVKSELKRRTDSSIPRSSFKPRSINGVKRSNDAAIDSNPRKRIKFEEENRHDPKKDSEQTVDIDSIPGANIIVQVNYSKFLVLMRNQWLVSMAEEALGRPTARVYREALRQIEKETLECRSSTVLRPAGADSDYPSPNLDVDKLAADINSRIRLEGTIAPWTPNGSEVNGSIYRPVMRRKRPPDPDGDRSDDENDDVDDHGNISGIEHDTADEEADYEYDPSARSRKHRTNGVMTNGFSSSRDRVLQHLHLLAEAPEEFVTYEKEDSISSWRINFDSLCSTLRDQKIFAIISDLFGNMALRLVRVLIDKGKLEEKALQEIALVSAKDLRQELAKLKAAGYLELQEVPRENQRQPSRTIYLWFYDSDRVRRKVLEDVSKSMTRILQRLQLEKQNAQSVLDKAERSDVRGHEEQYLAAGELDTLKSWRAKEEVFWGEIGRLDDLVAVLRDF